MLRTDLVLKTQLYLNLVHDWFCDVILWQQNTESQSILCFSVVFYTLVGYRKFSLSQMYHILSMFLNKAKYLFKNTASHITTYSDFYIHQHLVCLSSIILLLSCSIKKRSFKIPQFSYRYPRATISVKCYYFTA